MATRKSYFSSSLDLYLFLMYENDPNSRGNPLFAESWFKVSIFRSQITFYWIW